MAKKIDPKKLGKDALKNSKGFIGEFKTFIKRGNVMDLAVGVVIGSAFGKIVSSLVDDIIMPLVGILIGGHDFTSLSVTIGTASINYGSFIQNVVDFLIVALCIFIVMKAVNKFLIKEKHEEEAPEQPAEPSEEVKLLTEIRDALKKKK